MKDPWFALKGPCIYTIYIYIYILYIGVFLIFFSHIRLLLIYGGLGVGALGLGF